MNPKIVARRRARYVLCKIDTLAKVSGASVQHVKTSGGGLVPVELSMESLSAALVAYFEPVVYQKFGYLDGDRVLAEHYRECMGENKMSPYGVRFIDQFLELYVAVRDSDRLEARRSVGRRGS